MAIDVGTIVMWGAVFAIAVVIYVLWEKNRAPKLAHETSGHRGQPVVVTKAGILRLVKTEPRGPNHYQNFYEGGYNAVYYFNDSFNEVVPISDYQIMAGATAPAFIELAVLMERTHGADHLPWVKMSRAKLNELLEGMKHRSYNQRELDTITKLGAMLTETPEAGRNTIDQLQKEIDRAAIFESELASERAGTEGRRLRDIQPLIEVAGKQGANKKSQRDGTDS